MVSKKTFFNEIDFWVRFWAFLIRKLTPFWYKCTIPLKNKGINKKPGAETIIISLTSYPGRIDVVWMSIESILRQTIKPDKIILWLGKEKFSGLDELPAILKNQIKRGLTVEFREDLKPHTKYYHAMRENPESTIITVDDDIIYPPDLFEKLLKFNKLYPNSIICHGARKIEINGSTFLNYSKWPNWHKKPIETRERFDLLPLGVMGVLYPPGKLHEELFNIELLKKHSLYADDLWLKAMALKKGTKAVLTNSFKRVFVEITDSQTESLMSSNIGKNLNDKQFKSLDEEFGLFELYSHLMEKN